MNCFTKFLNRKIPITNWQIFFLKYSVACIAIAIGCYFADFFRPYLSALIAVGIILGAWIFWIWLKAMKEDS